MTPKISVIVPIYNVEEYLDKCLHSVRKQTLKDIEIICIDDCSPDNSYTIVEKHIKQDKRIKLIRHKKNLGLGGARNTAIRAAKADFLASVDSDDYMAPTMLQTLWDASESGWFDIVCCGYSRVNENGNTLSKVENNGRQISNDDNSINIFSINPAFWNKLWRKSLFIDNDIYFPEHDYYEDMSTTPRILAKSRYIKVIKDSLYRYLIREQSIMNGMSSKHLIDYLRGFEIIHNFLEENNLTERYREEFHRYIRGNFIFYSKCIVNSGLSIEDKSQFLRFLILFRITFAENFNRVNKFDISRLLLSLNKVELHGVYFDKFEQSLQEIDKKENTITNYQNEIDTKATKVQLLSDQLNEVKSSLEASNTELNKTLQVVSTNENLLSKHLIDTKAYKKTVQELKEEKHTHQIKLTKALQDITTKEDLVNKQLIDIEDYKKTVEKLREEKITILQGEVADKISFPQIFAVFFFAIVAYSFMNKQQVLKLINKPRIFFRDSKSSLARKYASWFNLI